MSTHTGPRRSAALLVLTVVQLIIALVELGLLAFIQWAINDGQLDSFIKFRVVPVGTGIGLFVTCHTVLFAIYILVTTYKFRLLYNQNVALAFVLGAVIFWLVTWGMYVNVLTLLGMSVPASGDTLNTYDGYGGYEVLGYDMNGGIWGSVLTLAIVEWLSFVASTVLLWRGRTFPNNHVSNERRKDNQDNSTI